MKVITKIIVVGSVLIGIFLFLSKPEATAKIISTLGKNTAEGVKTFQGR